jgi:DNA-binding XRE family transcriptional regulator
VQICAVATKKKSPHSHGRSQVRLRPELAPAIEQELNRLGELLRTLRTERGLTQKEAAEAIGLHPGYLTRVEGGRTNLTVATLVAASVAFNVPLSVFFPPEDERD